MKLSVPFNGQDDLIPQLSRYPEAAEVYGKLTADFIGGGKHSFQTPFTSKKKIERNVKRAHKHGLEFNYLLNSSCLGNREWTAPGRKEIIRLVDWVVSLDIDSITVGTPYLLELIKRRYPKTKVDISTLAGVNTARKAKYWEDMGVDRITLLNVDVNRDFSMIRHIRQSVKCQLKLILNSNCLHKCPFYRHHANVASHASQSGHFCGGFVIDYCRIECRYRQMRDPVKFIRSTWIRPEDVFHYEKLGVDYFKIIDRGMPTQKILSIVKSYVDRSYDGNLLDLFPNPARSGALLNADFFSKVKYFFRPFTVNIFKLRKLAGLLNTVTYIDNKKLDGFMENIMKMECDKRLCRQCNYCNEVCAKAVRIIDNDLNIKTMGHYKDCLKDIVSGDMFKYF